MFPELPRRPPADALGVLEAARLSPGYLIEVGVPIELLELVDGIPTIGEVAPLVLVEWGIMTLRSLFRFFVLLSLVSEEGPLFALSYLPFTAPFFLFLSFGSSSSSKLSG
tara:strand:+ start:1213 stop:1542 length:330 start_codon:yes stop_codon:yes gene_type:complete